jgi:2-polyprenyl-3-methyl-5-hydroxy-6-metoxy-1,4-benzoquinol methylase
MRAPETLTDEMNTAPIAEIDTGQRFPFGKNWQRFSATLNEERLQAAERSLTEAFDLESFRNMTFLDMGSGSGLFSLAARRLGADVRSCDYDPECVACTGELRRRYFPGDERWIVEQGSVLDKGFVASLGRYDVVYSWGVLHHTGDMYRAFELISSTVAPNGRLCVAIYNDQGAVSGYWTRVKRIYNRTRIGKVAMIAIHWPYLFALRWLVRTLKGKPIERGMSLWHDMLDWLGGYPFEVAKPEAVFAFFHRKGFALERMTTCRGRSGCNEFVFKRAEAN